jgi:hypothetical protein
MVSVCRTLFKVLARLADRAPGGERSAALFRKAASYKEPGPTDVFNDTADPAAPLPWRHADCLADP